MKATIWHNPDCGTSSKTLAILVANPDIDLSIIEYKKTPFAKQKLIQLLADSGLSAREALRIRGTNAAELGLTDPATSNDQIIEAMVANAILVERPLVETDKGVRLCRPQERIHEIL